MNLSYYKIIPVCACFLVLWCINLAIFIVDCDLRNHQSNLVALPTNGLLIMRNEDDAACSTIASSTTRKLTLKLLLLRKNVLQHGAAWHSVLEVYIPFTITPQQPKRTCVHVCVYYISICKR